ncbi:Hypothetical predicted protein [Paramuricea clavata]|nr:Hypothetical predicted protein [Paramuricea clavata]
MAAKPKFSSTPASVIYAQSWPVPSTKSFSQRYPVKANSNSQTKSLDNSPWICKPKRQVKRPQKVASPAIHQSPSWASSMLSSNYPGWLESDGHVVLDMAKEFKMTLQMFKKLTDQVKEVDEQLNSCRKPYSFKHYFSNKNRYNTRRTNMRSYTPEIPMTNEEYQPCNNLGFKREQQRPPSQFGMYRKADKPYTNTSNSKHEIWPSPNTGKLKPPEWQVEESLVNENDDNHTPGFQNEHFRNEASIDLDFNDGDIFWSGCLEFSDEDNHAGLGYIDPVPEDWEVRKLEELELEYCSDKSGSDPFMVRYLQLRRLEIETVELDRGNGISNPNSVPALESGLNKVTITNKGKKTTSSKKQSSKINGASENVEKNPRRVLKKSSTSSLQDFEKYIEEKGVRSFKKESKDSRKETAKDIKQAKIGNSEKRSQCKSAKGKRRVQSCKSRPASYSSSVTYDILELAASFDPPSKERMKLNPRPVTAKSAKSKGMIPGKTWSSQRRFSLTAGQSLQSLPSDICDSVVSKSRASSAKKRSKRNTKRCSSSKF